jgi:hypothetical protein
LTKGGGNKGKYDWSIRNNSIFRKNTSKAAKRDGRRFCALSLVCAFIWQGKCQANGLSAASNHL